MTLSPIKPRHRCSVPGCAQDAAYAVVLKDDSPRNPRFQETSNHCPYICHPHAVENDAGVVGIPADGAYVTYPFVRTGGSGFLRYKNLRTRRFLEMEDFRYPALQPSPVRAGR
jgi:hypothetical protein